MLDLEDDPARTQCDCGRRRHYLRASDVYVCASGCVVTRENLWRFKRPSSISDELKHGALRELRRQLRRKVGLPAYERPGMI